MHFSPCLLLLLRGLHVGCHRSHEQPGSSRRPHTYAPRHAACVLITARSEAPDILICCLALGSLSTLFLQTVMACSCRDITLSKSCSDRLELLESHCWDVTGMNVKAYVCQLDV